MPPIPAGFFVLAERSGLTCCWLLRFLHQYVLGILFRSYGLYPHLPCYCFKALALGTQFPYLGYLLPRNRGPIPVPISPREITCIVPDRRSTRPGLSGNLGVGFTLGVHLPHSFYPCLFSSSGTTIPVVWVLTAVSDTPTTAAISFALLPWARSSCIFCSILAVILVRFFIQLTPPAKAAILRSYKFHIPDRDPTIRLYPSHKGGLRHTSHI